MGVKAVTTIVVLYILVSGRHFDSKVGAELWLEREVWAIRTEEGEEYVTSD